MATAKSKGAKTNTFQGEPFYKKHLYPILIFAFSFLLYANTIPNYYNLDDELVTRNHKFTSKGLSGISEILTSPYYSDDQGYSYDYRPLVHISFAFEHQFFGESAHTSHFFNALLYACLCIVLFFVLRAVLPVPDTVVLIAVALFAAHPIHTEVVASIKNRDEILMMLFSLLSLYVYIKWETDKYIAAICLTSFMYILAVLSKSTSLPFAFLIPFTILLFRKPGFGKFTVLSVTLTAIAVYFLPNTQLSFKLKVAVLLISANFAAYCLISFVQHYEGIIEALKNSFKGTSIPNTEGNTETSHTTLSFNFPRGFNAALLGFVWLTTLAAIYSLFANIEWLTYSSVFLLVLFFALSTRRSNFWFIIPLIPLVLLITQKYDARFHTLSSIIAVSLACIAYCTKSKHRILLLGLLAVFILHWAFISGKTYFFSLLVFSVWLLPEHLKKKTSIVFSIVLIAVLFGTILRVSATQWHIPTLSNISVTLLALVWFIKPYNPKIFFRTLTVIFLLVFVAETFVPQQAYYKPNNLFQYTHQNKYTQSSVALNNSLQTLNNVSVPTPVTISTDRPLNYIETPVPLSAPLKTKVASALDIMLRYAKLLVVPHPLLFYYGYKVFEPVTDFTPIVIFSLLLHLGLFITALLSIRRYPVIAWAVIFYLAFIATLTNVFMSIPGVIGERYLLVPSMAFSVLIAWLIVQAAEYFSKRSKNSSTQIAKWATIAIVVVYSGATMYRNSLWKDDITLFSHDIKNAPESAQGHNLLAIHLVQKSFDITDVNEQTEMRKRALYHFKESNRIYPKMFNAAYDIGRAYAMLNMPDSAIAAFQYASTLDTNFFNIQLSIAEIYYSQAKYDSAVPYLHYLIRKLPDYYPTYEKLSYILFLKKDYRGSVEVNKQAISKIPNAPEPYINIVRTFIGENKIDSARYYALQAYRIAPQNQMAQQMVRELGISP